MRTRLSISILALALVGLAAWLALSPPPATGIRWQPTATPAPAARGLETAVQAAMHAGRESLLPLQLFEHLLIDTAVSADGAWGLTFLAPLDPHSGEVIPSEPGVVLAHKVDGIWQVYLPNHPDWGAVLAALPEELVSAEAKAEWLAMQVERAEQVFDAPLGGYYLPWQGGLSMYVSGSVSHDSYIPSGSSHFAFDFSSAGAQMFNLHASKAGRVWLAVWHHPNGNPNYGNYLVIEDTSTTPTTYVLYLHLAQDSIPEELRVRGAAVARGQFIGVADDTGMSTANHVHFHVHTSPTSYYGFAVDITFNDVAINGGRPRHPLRDPAWCQPTDVCEVFQYTYVSGNYLSDDFTPPAGGLLQPGADFAVIESGNYTIEGWALDDLTNIAEAQILANWDGAWQAIGPAFSQETFSYNWNLCASGVPVGPLALALRLRDHAGNQAPGLPGLRQVIFNYNCPPQPPACTPSATQAALFSQAEFQGACVLLNPGAYASASAWSSLEQVISLKLGSSTRLTWFSAANYGGRAETFSQSDVQVGDNRLISLAPAALIVSGMEAQPGIPAPQSPLTGALLGETPTLDLLWRDTGGAQTFQARLFTPSQTYTSTWQTQPTWRLDQERWDAGADLVWQVRAANSAGQSAWSQPITFTIQTDSTLAPPAASLPYTAGFEGGAAGWRASGGWQLVNSSDLAHSGSAAWRVSGAAGATLNAALTSPPIEVPAAGAYSLTFYYRYASETSGLHWDQRWLQIAVDGGAFVNLLQLSDDPMGGWLRSPAIDLSPYQGSQVELRFSLASLDSLENANLTWSLDDLSIQPASPPLCAGDAEPNNTPAQALPLSLGNTVSGVICPAGDIDYYIFSASAGQRLSADIDSQTAGSALDGYLFLLDAVDGSRLAASDDELAYVRLDPHLGYLVQRSGQYLLKLRAWDHPSAGGAGYPYTLTLTADSAAPQISLSLPVSNGYFPQPEALAQAAASDAGSGLRYVRFWWHTPETEDGAWQVLGDDIDGSDGWSAVLDASSLPDQGGLAVVAVAVDWAGNAAASSAASNVALDRTAPVSALSALPDTWESTALPLNWDGSDNLTGIYYYEMQQRLVGQTGWQAYGLYPSFVRAAWHIASPGEALEFRLRAVDLPGNLEAYPDAPEVTVSVLPCSAPDAWEAAAGGDNSPETATDIQPGDPLQIRNFCLPDDEDWLRLALKAGELVQILALPGHVTSAPALSLYLSEGDQLTLAAQSTPAGMPAAGVIQFQPAQDGVYYLKISHLDGRVAGNAVSYRLLVGEPRNLYLPVTSR